jgi:DNA-binding PadR family transcriptional regulator
VYTDPHSVSDGLVAKKTESARVMVKKYSKTIYTLLSLLNIQPMSGYDIKLTLKKIAKHFWSESDGQIYPGLSRCVEDQLATFETNSSQSKHLHKKTYKITPKGRTLLNHWLNDPDCKITHRDESLLKLTFFEQHHDESAKKLLQARLQTAQKNLKALKQSLNEQHEHTFTLRHYALVQERQCMLLETEIKWAQMALDLFAQEIVMA